MRAWTVSCLGLCLVFLMPVATVAQTAMRNNRIVTTASDRMIDPGLWEVFFTHRFTSTISDSDLNDLFGLDGFALAGFGLAYGVHDRFNVGIYRTALEKNFELWTRVGLLIDPEKPLHVSLRTSLNFNTDDATNDPLRVGFQLVTGWKVGRFTLDVVPSLVTHPSRAEGDEDVTFAVVLGGGVTVTDALSLVAEVVPVLAGYRLWDSAGDAHISWGAGVQIEIGGHVFTLLVSNQFGTTLDRVLPGADLSEPRFGFNLLRRF